MADPAGEMTLVDNEPVDAKFVMVVEPGALEKPVHVNPLDPLVHVVFTDAQPERIEERVGTMLNPAEDERVDPRCLASLCPVLNRPIGENVVEPDDPMQFVLKTKRSTVVGVPAKGSEDLAIFVPRELPPSLSSRCTFEAKPSPRQILDSSSQF